MLVIVGHGPSIVGKKLGSWIDQQTVVRLKTAPRPNAEDWGTRIDYQCASTPLWPHLGVQVWVLPSLKERRSPELQGKYEATDNCVVSDGRWWPYFQQFAPNYKMSTGLRAIFCAVEFLAVKEIALVGFDNVLRPWVKGLTKWNHEPHKHLNVHDYDAEHRAVYALGLKIWDPTCEADSACLSCSTLTQSRG